MLEYSLRWSPHAKADTMRLHAFLDEKNPTAAWRAMERIQRAAHMLKSHPMMGRRVESHGEERQLVVPFGKTAYILRYRLDDGEIVILRVWNAREDWPYDD